jgi:hypothetical protein
MYRRRSLRLGNFGAVLEGLGYDPDFDDTSDGGGIFDSAVSKVISGSWCHSDKVQYAFDHIAQTHFYVPADRLNRLYGDTPPVNPEAQRHPRKPSHPAKNEPALIAGELNLSSARSLSDLQRIRRNFARRNHPDSVPHEQREEATRRMTIANTLIDRAMLSLRFKAFG